jgi:hypothetical protein
LRCQLRIMLLYENATYLFWPKWRHHSEVTRRKKILKLDSWSVNIILVPRHLCVPIYRETLFEPCRSGSYRVHYEFPSVGLSLKKKKLHHWSRNVLIVRNPDCPLPCWQKPAWGKLMSYFSDIQVWSRSPVTASVCLVFSSVGIARLKSWTFLIFVLLVTCPLHCIFIVVPILPKYLHVWFTDHCHPVETQLQ